MRFPANARWRLLLLLPAAVFLAAGLSAPLRGATPGNESEPGAHPPAAAAPAREKPAAAASPAPSAKQPATEAQPVSAEPAPAAQLPPAGRASTEPAREIQSLFNLGSTYLSRRDYASAEVVYQQVLRHPSARKEQQWEAVLCLARMYRQRGDATRAVACYEKYLKVNPEGATPVIYLEMGRTFRILAAYKLAYSCFYNVINATMKIPEGDFEQYRTLAKTAQFEIAETHFQQGDFEEASRFFSRLQLLDLAPADRARAEFKAAYSLVLAKSDDDAVKALKTFLDHSPDDENAPEARHLLATTLRRLGRNQESFDVVIALLRTEQSRQAVDPRRWAYWQRRTGNQVANEFYEQGNYWSALLIYEALTSLSSNEPSWRLPALYQAGLCYERLRQYNRARANYEEVIKVCPSVPAKESAAAGLGDLARMATWRLNHLGWTEDTDSVVTQIFRAVPSQPNDPARIPQQP